MPQKIHYGDKLVPVEYGDTGAILELHSDQLRFGWDGGDSDFTVIQFLASEKDIVVELKVDRKEQKLSITFPLEDPQHPPGTEKDLKDIFSSTDTTLIVYVHELIHQVMADYVDLDEYLRPDGVASAIKFIKYTYLGDQDPFFDTSITFQPYKSLKELIENRG
ncbi:hypothetical protein BDV25DRAFT_136015 [Aspergillus avenaceus]|uniref:Uncharacterized protein n=1 Tax=Aspergillus avenaceus TaxID=36643 RepID=A0A5N6U6U7_ASPAV|nr:hypothetical protein BDV25DRAFT_136015 [Aspergillus avenaceus]